MNVEDQEFAIDPEQAKVWNDDTEPDLALLHAEEESSVPETSTEEESTEVVEPEEQEVTEETLEPETGTTEATTEVSTEQPEESDSADDTTVTDNTPEEEPSENPEDTSDASVNEVTPETFKIKANGMEFDLTTEELAQLAPKGLDYTKKMQEIAPWRKTISALKEQGLGETDVNLMIDVLKGDTNAIQEVLKRTGVDTLDLDPSVEQEYKPNDYGKPEPMQRIEEIVQEISADPEYSITEQVIDSQWDSESRSIIAQNPDMIRGLHQDIKAGVYDKVAPIAFKMKAMGQGVPGMSDLDYYIAAGKEYFAQSENTQVTQQQKARETREADIQKMAPKRKAAAPSKTSSSKRDVIDYLADDDESFDEWYKDLMSKT